jgi:pyruvate dehydrogenase E2 component (dihydrolipoamide acetyltransferase)
MWRQFPVPARMAAIVKKDVEAAIAAGTGKAPAAAAAPPPQLRAGRRGKGHVRRQVLKNCSPKAPTSWSSTTACARPLPAPEESKQTIPHFYVTVDCELDALLALRAAQQGGASQG